MSSDFQTCDHTWTWQWFGLVQKANYSKEYPPVLQALRTCSRCSAFQVLEPQTMLNVQALENQKAYQAEREVKKARQREYNRKAKERREAAS